MSRIEMEELGKQPSVIRELFEYGKKRKSEIGNDKVFDFSIGNPSVPSPKIVNETLINLITTIEPTKLHGYTSAAGDFAVRKEIAKYLNNKFDANEKAELIYLTCGAAASLSISLKAIVDEGDEVIVIAPYFPEYKVFIKTSGAKLVIAKSNEDDLLPDLNDLNKLINNKTKAVIINSPNNPTGVVYDVKTVQAISDLLIEKSKEYSKNIYLISDEPYRELVYSDIEVPYVPKYYANTIVCYSFSKSISLPGERIGYVLIGNECDNSVDLFAAICGAGRSLGYVCAPALFQYMIPSVLGKTSNLECYKENLKVLSNALRDIGYTVVNPNGAFYLFVKALEKDAKKFSDNAKKFELLLVPSDSFGISGFVRIAYCVSLEQINNSIEAFKKLYEFYK